MVSLILAGLLHLQPARPPEKQQPRTNPILLQLPASDNSINAMFVADKGGKYKLVSLPQFQKILNKCMVLRVDGYDTQQGALLVFRCEESF